MQDNSTFFEKLAILKHWHPYIIDTVRKDLKKDHLQRDPVFVKKYLPGKSPVKVTSEEMVAAYAKAFEEQYNNEAIAEFITNRWLLKTADIYHFFEQQLTRINPDVTQIKVITNAQAEPILKEAVAQFGAPDVYLFCRLNCVALQEDQFEKLDQQARAAYVQQQKELEKQEAHQSVESMKTHYEQQIARITDRFEKKISGLERKYVQDVDTLKKQIGNLQRKMAV